MPRPGQLRRPGPLSSGPLSSGSLGGRGGGLADYSVLTGTGSSEKYVEVPGSTYSISATSFSVAQWLKVNAAQAANIRWLGSCLGAAGLTGPGWFVGRSGTNKVLMGCKENDGTSNFIHTTTASWAFTGSWELNVLTVTPNSVKIYQDGSLFEEGTGTFTPQTGAITRVMPITGWYSNLPDNYMDDSDFGYMAVWLGELLTSDDVTALYNSGTPIRPWLVSGLTVGAPDVRFDPRLTPGRDGEPVATATLPTPWELDGTGTDTPTYNEGQY